MKLQKIFAAIFLVSMLFTTTPASAEMPDITAGETKFDFKSGRYVLKNNVKVVFTDRTITAEEASVDLYNEVMNASGDVTMTSENMIFRCDEMSGEWAKHGVDVSGNVRFEILGGISIYSERGSFSWKTKLADFYNATVVENGVEKKFNHVQYHVIENQITESE